jgi:putative tryptophan/tyrosine transport system substrate-binding protein
MNRPPSPLTMLLSRHTRRREFIAGLGGAAAWPLVAEAQQPAIGFLGTGPSTTHNAAAFQQGLGEQGYIGGQNVEILFRYAPYDRLPALAEALVRRPVSVIVASGGPVAALAAKSATTRIPIVFLNGADPVKLGLVESLNRPGRNITGVAFLVQELTAKRLALLHEIAPAITSIGLLVNSTGPQAAIDIREAETAAHALGVHLVIQSASIPNEIEEALSTLLEQHVGALLVGGDAFLLTHSEQLAASVASHKVPAIYALREFVQFGGLMSYGASFSDAHRIAGTYVGRILKGEKPGDLPVQQPTRFELAINLKTAKALGLTIPPTLLALADEVIE